MTPNDKLPETTQERIKADADAAAIALSKKEMCGPIELMGYRKGYIAGATAWAGWKVRFDEERQQRVQLEKENDVITMYYNGLKERAEKLKTVLQEFVSNHEAGLLPNRFVYEKAIKILNDGK